MSKDHKQEFAKTGLVMSGSWIQVGSGIEITEGRDNILSETKKLPEDISAAFLVYNL